jgi:hypothetical protein
VDESRSFAFKRLEDSVEEGPPVRLLIKAAVLDIRKEVEGNVISPKKLEVELLADLQRARRT